MNKAQEVALLDAKQKQSLAVSVILEIAKEVEKSLKESGIPADQFALVFKTAVQARFANINFVF